MQHRGTTIEAQEGRDIIVRTVEGAEFKGFGYRGEECAVGIRVWSSGLSVLDVAAASYRAALFGLLKPQARDLGGTRHAGAEAA
jgi:hypothetical protein